MVGVALGEAFLALVGIALTVYGLYLLYSLIHRAFRAVGFTTQQASLIILGTFVGGFINVPLAEVNGWILAVNVGGAVIPVVVAWLLLRDRPGMVDEALVGVALTAVATYLVTEATPMGIVSPFPWYLVPSLVAAGVSAVAFWQDRDDAAPLAYVSGTLGALIGADVFRLGQFLAQAPPVEGTPVASIGGAAVFDMVFLTGVIAVGLDLLLFRQRRKDSPEPEKPYFEGVVFRSSTPPEDIQGYAPSRDPALFRAREPRPAGRGAPAPAPNPVEEWQRRLQELQGGR